MANSEHVTLAKSGPNAIARWRELTFRSPNEQVPRFSLGYRLEDRAAGETFPDEFIYGRPALDLSGASMVRAKLSGVDFSHDDLSRADLTQADLRLGNLSGANLQNTHLFRSNLSNANLTGALMGGASLGRTNLTSASLKGADARGADLSYSGLTYADLEGANLSGSDLTNADLSWANLRRANLRGAKLTSTTLKMADLSAADLRGATIIKADMESSILYGSVMGITTLVNCDLNSVIGLNAVVHRGPSTISLDTLARSGGSIPKTFLEGAGVAAPLIAAQEAMNGVKRSFPTVLIVGSRGDQQMAERLRAGLAAADIPSWDIAVDDETALQSGRILPDQSIFYDRLILLCTEHTLQNPLSSRYLAELARGERDVQGQTIITLGADRLFFDREDRLCTALKKGLVLDFRGWEEVGKYEEALKLLVAKLAGAAL